MNAEQQAAFIFAQAVSALIELEAMKATNAERELKGQAQAWNEEAFMSLQSKYVIAHNDVLAFYQQCS